MIKNKKIVILIMVILVLIILSLVLFRYILPNLNNKKIDGLVIMNDKITFNDSNAVYFFSADVKNISKKDKDDVTMEITFYNKSKKEITNVTGFLGDIESKKTVEMNVAVSKDLKDVASIKYEIVE